MWLDGARCPSPIDGTTTPVRAIELISPLSPEWKQMVILSPKRKAMVSRLKFYFRYVLGLA